MSETRGCWRTAPLKQRIAQRLARGTLGDIAREAVHSHPFVYGSRDRVHVAPTAVLNGAILNCSSGHITVEDDAFFGHGVSLLTGTHEIAVFGAARKNAVPTSGRDIHICQGAWVSSNVTVVGPCRIGEHAVIAAGSLVLADVPAFAVVAGVPAEVRRYVS